jgi:hypothetical protein
MLCNGIYMLETLFCL